MSKTMIEYADAVWNPITGCTKVSDGCKNCWAERFAPRLKIDFNKVKFHPERIKYPKFPRRPSRIFVCSMSDLFHPAVPEDNIAEIFSVMIRNPVHTFLVLTKRPARALEYFNNFPKWISLNKEFKNIWIGVSVEDQETADERIPALLQIPAALRFISAEPLLGEIDLSKGYHITAKHPPTSYICQIDWVITGGESGHKARPTHPDWFRSLRDQCKAAGIPFWFKQWGNYGHNDSRNRPPLGRIKEIIHFPDGTEILRCANKNAFKRTLDGREWNEIPNTIF